MKFSQSHFRWFGIVGVIILTLTSLVTALFFRTAAGFPYSPLNHFISELGWEGHSTLAGVFNSGLILSGVLFIGFLLGLGFSIHNAWAKIGMICGVIAAIFCSLVGVFPINHLPQHIFVAMGFFRGGLATVILFAIAIQVQPKGKTHIPKTANFFSITAIMAYGSFLILNAAKVDAISASFSLGTMTAPPSFRLLAVVEWGVFIFTILWFLGVALLVPCRNQPAQ